MPINPLPVCNFLQSRLKLDFLFPVIMFSRFRNAPESIDYILKSLNVFIFIRKKETLKIEKHYQLIYLNYLDRVTSSAISVRIPQMQLTIFSSCDNNKSGDYVLIISSYIYMTFIYKKYVSDYILISKFYNIKITNLQLVQ